MGGEDTSSGELPQAEERFSLRPGASWLSLDGTVYIVPGFHEEWIRKFRDFVGPYSTVAELVVNKRWISVVLYSGGYLEICINDRKDPEVRTTLWTFLSTNVQSWNEVLIMPFEEEGFIHFTRDDVDCQAAYTEAMNATPSYVKKR
ncbi:MAG: hypothetical protein ABR590_02355 [Spirochaetia bacterium]